MTNQHDKPDELAAIKSRIFDCRAHDFASTVHNYCPFCKVDERDKHMAELEAALRVAREAIESLPDDALGTATPIDAYPYPIRDEVINTISQALKGKGNE